MSEPSSVMPREEEEVVMEEGFEPFSLIDILRKNGRYVAVAKKNISAGELIEKSTFVVSPYRANEPDRRATVLANVFPVFPCSCDTCKVMGPSIIIPSGNMMLIQHSRKPNIKISFDGGKAMIRLFAENSLTKGDELFIDYTDLYAQDEVSQEAHFDDVPTMNNMDLDKQIYAQL